MPKIYTLYDSGTAEPLEDRVVSSVPFFAVFDGVSGLYHPSHGWRAYEGKSGGQRVVDLAEDEMRRASPTDSPVQILERINERVRAFNDEHNISEPHDIPGTTFAFAKVTDSEVEIVQGGDAFAVWRYKDGSVGATPNPNYDNEAQLLQIVQSLVKKHAGDKRAVWDEYLPILKEAKKRANAPAGYTVLNGDIAGESLWYKKSFAKGELDLLLLITDGLVTLEETKDTEAMAQTLVTAFTQGSTGALLARVRAKEEGQAQHVKHAEASVVAIEFN